MILRKKQQEPCKSTVWNLGVWIFVFELVLSEEIDPEMGHFPQLLCAFSFVQPLMEEVEQERLVGGTSRDIPRLC